MELFKEFSVRKILEPLILHDMRIFPPAPKISQSAIAFVFRTNAVPSGVCFYFFELKRLFPTSGNDLNIICNHLKILKAKSEISDRCPNG